MKESLKNRGMPGYSILGFDQNKGFNISEGELFLFAPVDPYFNLYANIPFTENGATLEEAYFVTTALPEGLQMKGGKFKSGISRFNAQHPHAWDFADAPLVYRAFTGKEGIIEKGVQFTYLPSFPSTRSWVSRCSRVKTRLCSTRTPPVAPTGLPGS